MPTPEGSDFAQLGQSPQFRDEAHKLAYIRMIKNLLDVVNTAGGNFAGIDFTKMTVSEMLLDLCTNDIGFIYMGPRHKHEIFKSLSTDFS